MKVLKLHALLNELQSFAVDSTEYDGEIADAVVEITSTDSFVAGIAMTLLDGERPDLEHRALLSCPLLEGNQVILGSGQRITISGYPELRTYALLVERVRVECQRLVLS